MLKDSCEINPNTVLHYLQKGELLAIAPESSGGLILCKLHHAELVGPGAAVGGALDVDCTQVIPIGHLSFTKLHSYQEKQQAYDLRQKWIKYLQDLVKVSDPLVRSQKIFHLLDEFFANQPGIDLVPDRTLAMLVGVLPKTIALAKNYRQTMNNSTTAPKVQKKPYYESFGANFFQDPIYSLTLLDNQMLERTGNRNQIGIIGDERSPKIPKKSSGEYTIYPPD